MASTGTDEGKEVEDRRVLRGEIRQVQEEMLDNQDEMGRVGSSKYEEMRNLVNSQFQRTHHSREQLLDAENLKLLSLATKKQASKIDSTSSIYNFNTFADSIRNDFIDIETSYFSWTTLGKQCATIFRTIPAFDTLYGPIGKGYVAKERKKTEKPVDDGARLTRAESVEQSEEADRGNEATNERIKKLQRTLEKATSHNGKEATETINDNESKTVDLLKLLVDTKDKVQTIENFFDFAFLLQRKRVAESKISDDQLPRALFCTNLDTDKQQLVLSLDMKQLGEVNELLEEIHEMEQLLGKAPAEQVADVYGVLHRNDELYSSSDARDQAEILSRRQVEQMQKQKQLKSQLSQQSQQSPQSRRSENKIQATQNDTSISSVSKKRSLESGSSGTKKPKTKCHQSAM